MFRRCVVKVSCLYATVSGAPAVLRGVEKTCMTPWKRTASELLLDHRFMKIRRDMVELPSGERREWVYWDSRDSAMLVGMTAEHKLVMIRQYRYLVGDEVIEFPSGGMREGESPQDAAKREFEEETGYCCGDMVKLGSFYETYGQLNRKIHIFYATCVARGAQTLDCGDEGFEEIKVELVDVEQAVQLARSNKIAAFGSVVAVLLLERVLAK